MAITKLFAHFKTLAGFQAKLNANEINENGISFIKDTHQFYTHGEYYNCSLTDEQVDALIKAFIVNDVTTGGAEKVLSAEQGKLLNEAIVALQADLDAFKTAADTKYEQVSNKNVANGYAGLDENGKIDPSLVAGVVGHVLGIEQFVTENPTTVEEGKYYFNSTSKKILFGEGGAWVESDPQAQVLYNRRGEDENGHANTLYRWDGEQMTAVSDPIAIGETTGTAYDGKKGADNRAAILSLPSGIVVEIGAVTAGADSLTIAIKTAARKVDGLGFEAEADSVITIPVATTTASGLMSATDKDNLDKLVDAVGTGGEAGGETLVEKVNGLETSVTEIKNYTVNSKKISENPVLNGADVALTGFEALPDKTPGYTEAELTPVATDTVNQAIAKMHRAVLDNETVEAAAIAKLNGSLGFNENGEYVPTATELNGKNVTEAVDDLNARLVAEIARATAAEAQALADAKAYVDEQLGWYEGE